PLVLAGAQGFGYQRSQAGEYAQDFAAVSYYASALLGNHELAVGHDRSASEHFAAALLWADTLQGVVHLDALRNSAALAALGAGDRSAAIPLSRAAVSGDPRSPVYLMTSAAVAYRNGNVDNAIRQYRVALETDPSAYPAANNLGVHLAHEGHLSQAALALRAAVQANPAYALGWYNLGIVEGRRGPLAVVVSQGALARAVALDPSFADRPPRTVLDTATYRTGLDVSKPLPSGWSFAESQRKAPAATVGLLAVLLAGVGLARLRATSTDSGTGDWLGSVGGRLGRLRGIRRIQGPWWAVMATVAAFLLAFWREPLWPWTGIAYAVGLVALVGAGMLARALVARRSASDVVHGSWPPGVLVGLVSGAFGSPIAPLPVVRSPAKDARVAIAAPLTLAVLGLVLLLESAWLHTPLTTSLGVAALIMAGSLLIPVKPLDGARAGRAGVVGAVGLLGALLLLGLGLV
ncbi:MAG TPA: tetratricopeptide repeat protein, partial [Ornithinibacter sp.]|nr:tetratricopeptide repeat protein [Ornithinibacter sp.]